MRTLHMDDVADGVRALIMDRPERRNALDHATYVALSRAITEAGGEPDVRALVLTGANGTFTSGNDLRDFRRTPRPRPSGAQQLFSALRESTIPVVAAVEGWAVGIGTTMLLHCDLAYIGAGSRFRLPFTALGLTPEGGSSYLLPRLAGDKAAAELLLLGEVFDAERAVAIGLANLVVEEGMALAEAISRASALAELPPASVRATRALMRHHHGSPLTTHMRREDETFARQLSSPETQTILATFAQ